MAGAAGTANPMLRYRHVVDPHRERRCGGMILHPSQADASDRGDSPARRGIARRGLRKGQAVVRLAVDPQRPAVGGTIPGPLVAHPAIE